MGRAWGVHGGLADGGPWRHLFGRLPAAAASAKQRTPCHLHPPRRSAGALPSRQDLRRCSVHPRHQHPRGKGAPYLQRMAPPATACRRRVHGPLAQLASATSPRSPVPPVLPATLLPCRPLTNPQDMGVIEELKAADEVLFADNGGFVSPSGLSYIGARLCGRGPGWALPLMERQAPLRSVRRLQRGCAAAAAPGPPRPPLRPPRRRLAAQAGHGGGVRGAPH